ncbi:hypothetical protein [Halorussus pelagicus]|uniref:hypothetical protein n=1 Tax=Halorussus pelagicus TaxID=2505977 RepID=UPI001AA03872|nr:hypothetical protein [Halorussus pelagicus]
MVEQNVKAGLHIAERGYVLDVGENRYEESANEPLVAKGSRTPTSGSDAVESFYRLGETRRVRN